MKIFRYLLLCIAVLGVCMAGVSANQYVVQSGYDHPAEGTMVSPQPVSFWELPLWIILLQCACLPVEMIGTIQSCGLFGLYRIRGDDVLANDTRRKIFDCIRRNPGIHLRGIGKETDITLGTLRYHIDQLRRSHTIAALEDRGYTHYFENSGTYSASQQTVLKHMRNATTREILAVLAADRFATRKDIAESLDITGSTVTWHMKRLEEDGVIDVRTEGRSVSYIIRDDAESVIQENQYTIRGKPV
ncbi:winged helix-turn-helix transcriptional regulator [Methanogenium sp. S4BF]|uniref:winged helix-turn-helix transcriptional regulator n=1 Tax=Methanogenium sp. S4BF TaxID=1789226 RepID=UPI002417BA4D|nr:winged helix-turn-helix transcriptional regulator [Methanogenium sp. S4BF]WFN34107.1 winged helix-turn-helix transcriptional regulator [Methanogenium sp. S4BF]